MSLENSPTHRSRRAIAVYRESLSKLGVETDSASALLADMLEAQSDHSEILAQRLRIVTVLSGICLAALIGSTALLFVQSSKLHAFVASATENTANQIEAERLKFSAANSDLKAQVGRLTYGIDLLFTSKAMDHSSQPAPGSAVKSPAAAGTGATPGDATPKN